MLFTGKTVEETKKAALEELKLTEEDVEIEVVEEPTKGLFGKLKGKAVIHVTVKETTESAVSENPEKPAETQKAEKPEKATISGEGLERAREFLQGVLDKMEINAKTELVEGGENPVISVIAEKSQDVIGYRGEVLDALQTLAGAVANIGNERYKKVVVDCENYRERREDTLIALAHKLEQKATEMRREVILEPMNPFERRIIHTALADSTTVTTKSDGKEPNRYVVIVPNDKDEFSRPYNAGRNNGGRRNDRRDDRRRGGRDTRRGGFNRDRKGGSGFTEEKRKAPSGFGTYLGNSLKK